VGRNYGPTTDHARRTQCTPTVNNGHRRYVVHARQQSRPDLGSRGREFKSRQPDSKAPSEGTFPGERNVSPGRERPPFPVNFQMVLAVGSESMCSGPCTLLGRAQMGADVDIHCVASGKRHPLEPRPRDPWPRRECGGPGRDGSPLIWPLGSISGSCLSTAPAVQAFPTGPPVAAPSQLFPQGV
jgi:hypothetical protein